MATFAEYLESEHHANFKSEFHAGEIYAMEGGTRTHSRLSARMVSLLDRLMSDCEVYDSNLTLYIEQLDKGLYPDFMVLCGQPLLWNGRQDAILNPRLVGEVLSPSTGRYDQSTKVHYYHGIDSVDDILLIAQDEILVKHYARTDDRTWTLTRYAGGQHTIRLLDKELAVDDIYRGIL